MIFHWSTPDALTPSMKVPPKRKGNIRINRGREQNVSALNESPSEKEGKCAGYHPPQDRSRALNESPSEKEGKYLIENSC